MDHGSSGTTRQDQGAIAKFVAARGPGLHHVAMKTPDINAVLSGLDAAGVSVMLIRVPNSPRLPSLTAFERRPGRARGEVRDGPASETRHTSGCERMQ